MLARDWLNTYYLEDTGLFRVSLGQKRRPRPKPRRWADSIKRDFGMDPLIDHKGATLAARTISCKSPINAHEEFSYIAGSCRYVPEWDCVLARLSRMSHSPTGKFVFPIRRA